MKRAGLSKYAGNEIKVTGTFGYFSACKDNTNVKTMLVKDICDTDGNFLDSHLWLRVNSRTAERLKKVLEEGSTVYFQGLVTYYNRRTTTDIEYGIEGIKEITRIRTDLIVEGDEEQSVLNLYNAGATQKEIQFSLNIHTDKIKRYLRQNNLMSDEQRYLYTGINNLRAEGRSIKEIARIFNMGISTVTTYLPVNG